MRILLVLLTVFVVACGGGSSGDSSSKTSSGEWLIDTTYVKDGGPGKDGIPALDSPTFVSVQNATFLNDNELVIGTKINGIVRAFSHSVLNWHEVVNLETGGDFHVLNYCPLTGSADLWDVPQSYTNKTFGTSGLLFNSNLILYDRESDTNWSQMFTLGVNGTNIGDVANKNVVIETTWRLWKQMYPETLVLSDNTGFSRDYTLYPYGSYLTNTNLLFEVSGDDARLHPKTRVLGVTDGNYNKVFQIDSFPPGVHVINDSTDSKPYVAIGSSEFNFAVAYNSTLTDGTSLTFIAVNGALPQIMQDNEGNIWNIFGTAVSGARAGEQLELMSDFIAFWFAWTSFYPDAQIHSFN